MYYVTVPNFSNPLQERLCMSTKTSVASVSGMRSYLNRIARNRKSNIVTADDAHRYLDSVGVSPRNVTGRLRFINSVLRTPNFYQAGMVKSTRVAARGRSITQWKLER